MRRTWMVVAFAFALAVAGTATVQAQIQYADEVVEFVRVDGNQFNTSGDNGDDGSDALGPPAIDPLTPSDCTVTPGDPNGCWTSPGYVPGVLSGTEFVPDSFGQLDSSCIDNDPSSCPRAGSLTVRFTDNTCELDPNGPSVIVWEVGGKTEGFLVEVFNGGTKIAEALSAPTTQTNGDLPISFGDATGFFDTVRLTPTDNGGGDPVAENTSGPDFDAVECVVFDEPESPCEPDLIAAGGDGIGEDVGTVAVSDACDAELGPVLQIELMADEGYAFSEIHVGAGCVGDDNIPTNKKRHPKIGQFYSSEEYEYFWPSQETVKIPYADIVDCNGDSIMPGATIDVAVHAVVKYLEDDCLQPVTLHATANTHPDDADTTFPADIYRIFPNLPAEVLLTSQIESVTEYTANFNGNAFDGEYFYFSRFDWTGPPVFDTFESDLFFNNLDGSSGISGAIKGASGGTVHESCYYYFEERTDDLYCLPLNGDGTVGAPMPVNLNVLDDTEYGSNAVLAFGDIAVDPSGGKIFGSATRIPGFENVFFSVNIDGTGYEELTFNGGEIGAGGVQIAFGADGVLYGVNARDPKELITIDPETGDVDVVAELSNSYSDLATGPLCDVGDETAWGGVCEGGGLEGQQFGIPFADNGWAFYFTYETYPPMDCPIPE